MKKVIYAQIVLQFILLIFFCSVPMEKSQKSEFSQLPAMEHWRY